MQVAEVGSKTITSDPLQKFLSLYFLLMSEEMQGNFISFHKGCSSVLLQNVKHQKATQEVNDNNFNCRNKLKLEFHIVIRCNYPQVSFRPGRYSHYSQSTRKFLAEAG